jgi:hypothetical protein
VSGRRQGPRPRPTTRKTLTIAILLSLLLPGLGHAYAFRLPRALIWFGGTIVIGLVVGGGEDNTALAITMGVIIATLAALDIALVMWLEGRSSRRS